MYLGLFIELKLNRSFADGHRRGIDLVRDILVEKLDQIPLEKQKLEIVERKGIGHPDTICDAILDRVSIELCKEYLKRFGAVMHYNADKSLLVAGEVELRFGGGIVKRPMSLIFGDRATTEVGGEEIPVGEIAIRAAKEWFRENLRFVDPDEHVRYQVELKPGSASLADIFRRGGKVMCANDTSAAVGHAPMTRTERLVLEMERFANSKGFKREFSESGEDVKVMGFRKGDEVRLTVGMAFIDKFIENERDYFKKKDEISDKLKEFAEERADFKKIAIDLNTLDVPGRGIDGIYLTVLGTSADGGDSGQVGRGNRVNGVIPLNRHTCSEAAAGKNPVSHVGKIYNLLTNEIAGEVYERVPGLEEVYVWLVSQIGRPIDEPMVAAVQAIPAENTSFEGIKKDIAEVVDSRLANIDKFCKDLIQGKISVF